MPADDEIPTQRSAKEILAELVAKRKAANASGKGPGGPRRQLERDAATRSANKSKPAMRKN